MLADPERLELPTSAFEAHCSIQLSYGSVPFAVSTEKAYHFATDCAGPKRNAPLGIRAGARLRDARCQLRLRANLLILILKLIQFVVDTPLRE